MNSLSTALIIQILLCAALFGFLFYFMAKNAGLKKEIDSKIINLDNKQNGD